MNQIRSILRRGAAQPISSQRMGAMIGGGALALLGLTQRSKSGLAMAAAGGALVYMGTKPDRNPRGLVAQSRILVNCSPQEGYQFWHNFENLSIVMPHLESVTVASGGRTTLTTL